MSLSLFVYVKFTLCVDDRWQRKLFCWYRSDFYVLFWYILKKLDTASGTNELFVIYSTSLYAIHYPQYLFVWYLEGIFIALICAVLLIGQNKVVHNSFYIMHNFSNTKQKVNWRTLMRMLLWKVITHGQVPSSNLPL